MRVYWNGKAHEELGSILLRRSTLRKDIANAEHVFKQNLLRSKRWLLELSSHILQEDADTIENIVCSLLDVLFQVVVENHIPTDLSTVKVRLVVPGDASLIRRCIAKSERVFHARTMAMLPANRATPANMAQHLRELFQDLPGVRVTVLRKRDLAKGGYGLILGVGDSAEPSHAPVMVVVRRRGRGPRVAVVGKGVTFDTGGLAIKSWNGIKEMKFDKIGALYGAYALHYLLSDPSTRGMDLVGVFPFAENAVSDRALRPGDVVRSGSGKTVEVSDPDAEGRLLLADAFAYLDRHVQPEALIDIATLTGHANSVNCCHDGYYYGIPSQIKGMFEKDSEAIGERMVPMPTWEETGASDILSSKVADVVNTPYNYGDAYTAAIFLREFLPKSVRAWVHIDLAHEVRAMMPRGNGIRSIIRWVEKMNQGLNLGEKE